MNLDLTVPPSCLPQILLQRTGFRDLPDPAAAWADSIRADWQEVEAHLPEHVFASLDIGCGMAGFDVLLHRKFGHFCYLLDRDAYEEKPRFGFSDNPSAYCRWGQVGEMLDANGVPRSMWAGVQSVDGATCPVNLVTSFIAWGFHFPVDVYLDDVAAKMCAGARLIIDLRSEHRDEAMPKIENAIGPKLAEMVHGKFSRCVFARA